MPRPRSVKQNKCTKKEIWLKHFLDNSNPTTFLNKVQSVKAAKYKCNGDPSCASLGHENFKYHTKRINQWMEEEGLSENALKIKLLSLMDVTETKFFSATETDLEGKVSIIIEERQIPAIETQRRTLDMAIKVRGLYEKHQGQGAAQIIINSTEINKPKNAGTGKD